MADTYLGAAPLDERAEFLSDAWIALAEGFLRKLAKRHAALFARERFSICESFSDAPPHLGCPGNLAAWSFAIRGGEVTVAKGRNPDAGFQIEGDYQAILMVVQAVGPVALERARREMAHLYPDHPVRRSGTPPSAELGAILSELHDYLARRTVENPDVDHRIARQGLQAQVDELAENGFTVIRNAITPAFADELRERAIDEMLSHKSPTSLNGRIDTMGLIRAGRCFEEIVQHPHLRTVMETSLGAGLILQTVSAAMKGPGPSAVPIHADYVAVPDPYPEFSLVGVAVWALDDWTEASGPTVIIPGSQKRRRSPRPGDDFSGGVPVIMPKGSVTFFAHGVWHWQGDRTEPGDRVTLHNTYQRPFLRQADDFSNIDHVLHRHSPVLSTLTGHDDYFGRSTYAGHDMRRTMHMNRVLQWRAMAARAQSPTREAAE